MVLSKHYVAQGRTAIPRHINHNLLRNGEMIFSIGVVELHVHLKRPRIRSKEQFQAASNPHPAPHIVEGSPSRRLFTAALRSGGRFDKTLNHSLAPQPLDPLLHRLVL